MTVGSTYGFTINQPGPRTLVQDIGRYGYHRLGLTTGGAIDQIAFYWANRLCGNTRGVNTVNMTALEVSVGGLELTAKVATQVAVCGTKMPFYINGQKAALWQSHRVNSGDRLKLGIATVGVCTYLAVTGGFSVLPMFGSTSTIVREGIGGLDGGPLQRHDFLPCSNSEATPCIYLPEGHRPLYGRRALLRVVLGYQQQAFSNSQQQLFFTSEYQVSVRSDRMGYCLTGPAISTDIKGVLSEGICLGAIQIPPDGQPIILMNDRQTIGGYPKLGAVLSLDLGQLGQLRSGDTVLFRPITVTDAHKILRLANNHLIQLKPVLCSEGYSCE